MSINVCLEPLPPNDVLQTWWRELEHRADTTFYTSWSWIGNWLSILPTGLRPKLLTARREGKLVGVGLLVRGRAHLLRAIPIKCWHLHATGIEEFDELTIEYNGFLVDRGQADAVKCAMLQFLLYQTGVRRLEISKAQSHLSDLARSAPKGVLVRSMAATSYVVDLDQVRRAEEGYLSLLSANTRSQIRRSLTAYSELGPLSVTQAADVGQAKAFLTALKDLHGRTWQSRGVQSGFSYSPMAGQFHDGLIDHALQRGEVQVLRIAAGDTDLGYLYNFVHRGRVVFYQSGFNYGVLDKHDRPGLVCHKLAVEHNVGLGQQWYDFAAGDYRYKASLATHCEQQGTHVFQRDGLLPRLDIGLRAWKQQLRQWRSKGTAMVAAMLTALAAARMDDMVCADWLTRLPA